MKKFSQLNLINSSFVTGTGDILGKIFESKYVKLEIKVKKYSLLRGKMLVSDVNEILQDEYENDIERRSIKPFSIEILINLLYSDFIRQIQRGTTVHIENGRRKKRIIDHAAIAQSLRKQLNKIKEERSESVSNFRQVKANHYKLEEYSIQHNVKNDTIYFPVKILKSQALRGEVFLNDIYEQYPDLDLTIEEFLSLRFEDVIVNIKNGNYEILHAIIESFNDSD